MTYERAQFLQETNEDKNFSHPPRQMRVEVAAPLPDEPNSLELNIEDENLMDAEIIDEDLLIKTIRNI